MTGNDLVESLTISCRDVLHVVDILQPTFYLERHSPGLHQFLQLVDSAHILQGEQMTTTFYHVPVGIFQVERQPTELGAGSSVGTPAETILRSIALTGIAHTQGTMHKHLQFHIGNGLMNGGNLFQRQFPRQDHPTEAKGT